MWYECLIVGVFVCVCALKRKWRKHKITYRTVYEVRREYRAFPLLCNGSASMAIYHQPLAKNHVWNMYLYIDQSHQQFYRHCIIKSEVNCECLNDSNTHNLFHWDNEQHNLMSFEWLDQEWELLMQPCTTLIYSYIYRLRWLALVCDGLQWNESASGTIRCLVCGKSRMVLETEEHSRRWLKSVVWCCCDFTKTN